MNRCTGFFWNVERLFDVDGGPIARSLGATKANSWNRKTYDAKLRNVCAVLGRMTADGPIAFGAFCEIETKRIVDDIRERMAWTDMENLDDHTRDQGLDGCDVALLYSRNVFRAEPVSVRSFSLNNQFETRDILAVELALRPSGQSVHLFVVHWPSRVIAEGEALRLAHAYFLKNLIDRVLQFRREDLVTPAGQVRMPKAAAVEDRWATPVLALGDFNDEPFDRSIRDALDTNRSKATVARNANLTKAALTQARTYLRRQVKLFNPTWSLLDPAEPTGTYYRDGIWRVYDQVLASHGALVPASRFRLDPDSVQAFRESPIEADGIEIKVLSRNGLPNSFSVQTLQGASDHLPLRFVVEVNE